MDWPVDWRDGLHPPDAPGHAPINYWAWPAATGGRAHQTLETLLDQTDEKPEAIVLLLRSDPFANLRTLSDLKAIGLRVFVTWQDTGRVQIEDQLRFPWQRYGLRRALSEADGAVASTEHAATHFVAHGIAASRVHLVPTPYPFDQQGWDFSLPIDVREGILVGTRQFDLRWRQHAEALQLAGRLARACGCSVTVFNLDGNPGRRRVLELLGEVPLVNWIEQHLWYVPYLQAMAPHRIVVQRDTGSVPGQVAGDALMCGLVNVGGDGTVQRLAFPGTSEPEHDPEELFVKALQLLTNDDVYLREVEASRSRAQISGLTFDSARILLARLGTQQP